MDLGDRVGSVLQALALQDAIAEEHAGGFAADPPLPLRRADDAVQDPFEVGHAEVVLRDRDELELVADEAANQGDAKLRGLRGGETVVAAGQPAESPHGGGEGVERDVGKARDALETVGLFAAPDAVDDRLDALGGHQRLGVPDHRLAHGCPFDRAPGGRTRPVRVVVGGRRGLAGVGLGLLVDRVDRDQAFAVKDDQELARDAVGELGRGKERVSERGFRIHRL